MLGLSHEVMDAIFKNLNEATSLLIIHLRLQVFSPEWGVQSVSTLQPQWGWWLAEQRFHKVSFLA